MASLRHIGTPKLPVSYGFFSDFALHLAEPSSPTCGVLRPVCWLRTCCVLGMGLSPSRPRTLVLDGGGVNGESR